MNSNLDNKHTFIDLFAGCGGLSLGLEQAGFFPLFVNEINNDAIETYLMNRDVDYPHLRSKYNSRDIKDTIKNENFFSNLISSLSVDFKRDFYENSIDLVTGGPPCQGFSNIGLRRSYSVEKQQLPSNHLYQDMAYFVYNVRPKFFIFENVAGLMTARWTANGVRGEILKDVLDTFNSIPNYTIKYKLIHAKDYGVPQNRPRLIIIGKRNDIKGNFLNNEDPVLSNYLPKPTYDYPNIEDVLSDLMDKKYKDNYETKVYPSDPKNKWQQNIRVRGISNGDIFQKDDFLTDHVYSKHSDRIEKKFAFMIENDGKIPEQYQTKKFAQRVLPRKWGNKGPTITACSLPDDFVHYSQPRSLTVREMARLQTFPDWYKFAGKRTTGGIRRAGNPRESIYEREVPKYTQIGNAVPVKLAYEIGKHLKEKILESSN